MMRIECYLVLLTLAIVAQPARAQWRADARAVSFDRGPAQSYFETSGIPASAYRGAPPRGRPSVAGAIMHGGGLAVRGGLTVTGARSRLTDPGDVRLMFLGGVLGATAGYLVGDAADAGITSVVDLHGASTASYREYLAVLPAAVSGLGAAMGAGAASCVKFLFGSLYRLDSCADMRWMMVGALPGAALSYAFRGEATVATIGAIVLEALGAAIVGRLARNERETLPEW